MKILLWPNESLKRKCSLVSPQDPDTESILREMHQTMKAAGGIGLAANQVGYDKRLVVIDIGEGPEFYINPSLTRSSAPMTLMDESCLSLPRFNAKVKRYTAVGVRYQLLDGRTVVVNVAGLRAHVLQHEIDHLDGKFFIDSAVPGTKDRARAHLRSTLKARSA